MKKIFFAIAFVCLIVMAQTQTPLAALANSMAPGTWADFSGSITNWNNGKILTVFDIDSCGDPTNSNVVEYANKMTWDPNGHLLRFLGSSHGSCYGGKFLKFTESTSTFTNERWPSAWCQFAGDIGPGTTCPADNFGGTHSYEHQTLNPNSGAFYIRQSYSRQIWKFAAGVWTRLPDIQTPYNVSGALEWTPNGLINVDQGWGIWRLNTAETAWTKLANTHEETGGNLPQCDLTNYPHATYESVDDVTIVMGGMKVCKITAGGVVTTMATPPIYIAAQAITIEFRDPASNRILILNGSNWYNGAPFTGDLREYNPATDTWVTKAVTVPVDLLNAGLAYQVACTAISSYGVAACMSYKASAPGASRFWLYKNDAGVTNPPPTNHAPVTNAGPDQIITMPSSAQLSGSATDDGLPSGGSLTYAWSGAGITFTTATAAQTTASFTAAGTYTATLTVTDGQLSSTDTVVITVNAAAGGADTLAPTVPSNVRITATSGNSIELMWNASTDNIGVTGYKIFSGSAQIGTSTHTIFLATNLSPLTAYSFTVKAYDAAGNESPASVPVMATTDQLLAFAEKCAMPGVLKCIGFDSQAELRYHWPYAPTTGGADAIFGSVCQTALSGSNTNSPYDVTQSTYANVRATVQNGNCIYPVIDSTVKHSGAGSLKFPVPTHSNADSSGEFREVFKKYMDGTFGYVGPTTSVPDATAHHEGNVLWVQWYQRVDPVMTSTLFDGNYSGGVIVGLTTAGAGATTVSTTACNIPSAGAGRHLWIYGGGTNFVRGQYTITSVAGNSCSMVLTTSPTPSGAGGGITTDIGYIDGAGVNRADGWKQIAIFQNPGGQGECCVGTAQLAWAVDQVGLPGMYSYAPGTTRYGDKQAVRGCLHIGYVSSSYTEPPCIKYHVGNWQEYTARIECVTSNANDSIVDIWVDAQKTQHITDFKCYYGGDGGSANGWAQFFITPYDTQKDPNQDHTDTAVWYDDIDFSTQPIPMGSRDGTPSVNPCIIDPLKITGVKWPVAQTGSRSLSYNSGTKKVTSFQFTWPGTLMVTDDRNCSAVVKK